MSFIEVTSKPRLARDLIADSLPLPIPLTNTATFSIPDFLAVWASVSATLEAANGVAFFAPLKPKEPALVHDRTFPFKSVRVIIVLL